MGLLPESLVRIILCGVIAVLAIPVALRGGASFTARLWGQKYPCKLVLMKIVETSLPFWFHSHDAHMAQYRRAGNQREIHICHQTQYPEKELHYIFGGFGQKRVTDYQNEKYYWYWLLW